MTGEDVERELIGFIDWKKKVESFDPSGRFGFFSHLTGTLVGEAFAALRNIRGDSATKPIGL
jgi:hypothetical protein